MRLAIVAICLFAFGRAEAHDRWANGEPVPSWVKAMCCGPDDVHHLRADQVHLMADGWHIDGYPNVLPVGSDQPSPDGEYWAFWNKFRDGSVSRVYCFFTPFQGT